MATSSDSIPMRLSAERSSVAGRIAPGESEPSRPAGPPPLPTAPPIARQIPVDDPRWVLAVAVHQRMVGSMVRPEDRAKLVKIGRAMGLTVFATNLVIAVMQDAARRGRGPAGAIDGLLVIPSAAPAVSGWPKVIKWVTALIAAEAAILWWIFG